MTKEFPSIVKKIVRYLKAGDWFLSLIVLLPLCMGGWAGLGQWIGLYDINSNMSKYENNLLYFPPIVFVFIIVLLYPIIGSILKWKREPLCPHGKSLPFCINRIDYANNFITYDDLILDKVKSLSKRYLPRSQQRHIHAMGLCHLEELPLFNHICPDCIVEFDALCKRLESLRLERLRIKENLQAMDPFKFEGLIIDVFRRIGWKVTPTAKTGDYGSDGFLIDPKGNKWVLQCKRYKQTNQIGPKTIRELLGTVISQSSDKGVIVTTGTFSIGAQSARDDSKGKIELIDGNDLIKLISHAFPTNGSMPSRKAELADIFSY